MYKGLHATHEPPGMIRNSIYRIGIGVLGLAVVFHKDNDFQELLPRPDAREANLILAATTSSKPVGLESMIRY